MSEKWYHNQTTLQKWFSSPIFAIEFAMIIFMYNYIIVYFIKIILLYIIYNN